VHSRIHGVFGEILDQHAQAFSLGHGLRVERFASAGNSTYQADSIQRSKSARTAAISPSSTRSRTTVAVTPRTAR
jgi:hypothetical protein